MENNATNPTFKEKRIILMLGLTIITLGVYVPIWFLQNYKNFNKLHSEEKLSKTPFIILLILGIVTIIFPFSYFVFPSNIKDLKMLRYLLQLIHAGILIWESFTIRRMIIDQREYQKKDSFVSGLYTFLFSFYYFQYLINRKKL